MKITGPLIEGKFIQRPNRFLTRVSLGDEIVDSHLPDPGRLRELLYPGATVYLRPAAAGTQRKTGFTTVMVREKGILISLVSALPNQFVRESLLKQELPLLADYSFERAEVNYGRHRFDFLLRDPGSEHFFLEVKSVTFVEDGVAQFPDAVTARGTRHVKTLTEYVQSGKKAGILFVCQRPDAARFRPMHERDPEFAAALKVAWSAGVKIWCITTKVTLEEMVYYQEIPISFKDETN